MADWSIQEIARLAGTTSRTLRHYDDVGLVPPSRIGPNGYRYYDAAALVRLQRVLLLRQLGLGIRAIGEVLDGQRDDVQALRDHLAWLHEERSRIDRLIGSVERTLRSLEGGESPMAEDMFDGFDHTRYKEEVEQRWGADAYAKSDTWWRRLGTAGQAEFMRAARELGEAWIDAATRGIAPDSDEAQALARRHADWLAGIPGTPGHASGRPAKEYLLGLGEVYVTDERFAKNYGGAENAAFVRDALRVYADRNL